MKLYYSPGACSLAPHIVLREAGLKFDLEKVDLGAKKTASGEDYLKINPKGYVPALKLDNGEMLTEVQVLLQYIAEQKPDAGLAPRFGTMERWHLMEWLNFVSTEVHKQFGALFNPGFPPEGRDNQIKLIGRRLDVVEAQLAKTPFLTGDRFTLPDAYLFTVVGWHKLLKVDIDKWAKLKEFSGRVASRPAVKEALKAEGLAK